MEHILAAGVGEAFADTVAAGPLLLGILAAAAAGLVSFATVSFTHLTLPTTIRV